MEFVKLLGIVHASIDCRCEVLGDTDNGLEGNKDESRKS